ncbi:MAG TPA: Glu/Leu/Phe/Val dehydrogenase dimerization domain-containing protein [Acidimicrobiales bacterium]|nr:Glu/Leu/Phe/Val dehydrogenase dimerization domain-containing protein [Acidimicrobiales bacterium]
MGIFDRQAGHGCEQVVFCSDPDTSLRAIIAVHSTRLGPALGGTRFKAYENDDDALNDVLRLARGMTYKNAAAGLDLGGGKAVIIGNPKAIRSEALIRTYGRFVDSLGGRYLTAEDVGTTQTDMDLIRRETPFVTGVDPLHGGSGDPSEATAHGVFSAMTTVVDRVWGEPDLSGRHVVVVGVGKVGGFLVARLAAAGAKVSVADINDEAVRAAVAEHGATAVPVDQAHAVQCDILSPCALGGSLNAQTVPELACGAIVGAANNQLATPDIADQLERRGIVYAPDFVVNAGGVINIAEELAGYDRSRAFARVACIAENLRSVFEIAERDSVTSEIAAERLAERRMQDVGRVSLIKTRFDRARSDHSRSER